MTKPDIVPERLRNSINYKILVCIILGVISIHIIMNYGPDPDNRDLYVSIVSTVSPIVAGIASIVIGFRYSMTNVFTRAYVSLGIGLICAGIGEILYALYASVFDLAPFPSFADVFFLAYYPFILAHLIINIRFFKTKFSRKVKIWLISFPVLYSISFFVFYQESDISETTLSMAFIIPDSIALALTVIGAKLFRDGLIGTAWFILLLGMLSLSIADVWYYHLESLDQYSLDHPVNVLWYIGYWTIFYALYQHRKSI